MNMQDKLNATPILFHDGCRVCLDIAETLAGTMPVLEIVDLGVHPDMAARAAAHGVVALPCLVIGGKVLPISPHSKLTDIGAPGH